MMTEAEARERFLKSKETRHFTNMKAREREEEAIRNIHRIANFRTCRLSQLSHSMFEKQEAA